LAATAAAPFESPRISAASADSSRLLAAFLPPAISPRAQNKIDSRALPIGILECPALGAATPETLAAVLHAAKLLAGQGFTPEPFRLDGLDRALELWWFFFGPVIGHLLTKAVAGKEDQISPMLSEYLSHATSGGPITLDSFIEACAERDLLRARILRQMQDVPILLSAVSSAPAFLHGGGNYGPGTGYLDTMRFSQWLNLAGFPGASVPLALSNEGLPIGVQIIGRPHEDELILAVAERLEEARGPRQSPSMHS
jgi:Asp-tRNA(Asn)/Glu-tRNA(Gln) amidotransferase A subunit family amidase